jgi:hypothetical protein
MIDQLRDEMQHQVDAGGDAGAAQPLAILDIQAVVEHLCFRRKCGELRTTEVMRRAGVTVEQAGARREQRAGADRHEPMAGLYPCPQPVDDLRVVNGVFGDRAGAVDECVDVPGDDDDRIGRQRMRQRLDAGHRQADRRAQRARCPSVAHVETHGILDQIRAPQHFDRPGDVEQQCARR